MEHRADEGEEKPFPFLRIKGSQGSPSGHRLRDFLERSLVPYEWSDPEWSDPCSAPGPGDERLVVDFPDGTRIEDPTLPELAQRMGLPSRPLGSMYDLIVVGAGPSGLAAAVTAAADGLRTLVIERDVPGGQASRSRRIENYLGFPEGVSGSELARRALRQARGFGAEILSPVGVTSLRSAAGCHHAELCRGVRARDVHAEADDRTETERRPSVLRRTGVRARAVLITAGVAYRTLSIPGAERLAGRGVFHGAVIGETAGVRGHDVFIVGGGNAAAQAALHLAPFARQVTLLVRAEGLERSMSGYLRSRIASTPNVSVRLGTELVEARGEHRLASLVLRTGRAGPLEVVSARALFVFIGASPQTHWLPPGILRDPGGYILTGSLSEVSAHESPSPGRGRFPRGDRSVPSRLYETGVSRVFAAGDVRSGSIKGVAAAVGEGAMAAQLIRRVLEGAPDAHAMSTQGIA